jgi:hypothetical protein
LTGGDVCFALQLMAAAPPAVAAAQLVTIERLTATPAEPGGVESDIAVLWSPFGDRPAQNEAAHRANADEGVRAHPEA